MTLGCAMCTMICKKCGNTLPDDAKFCGICGSVVEGSEEVVESADVVSENTAADTVETEAAGAVPVSEEAAGAVPVSEETADAVPVSEEAAVENFAAPEFDAAPKKKKKKIWRYVIPAVALALVAVIVFNFSTIYGHVIKTFSSNETYYKYVEQKALSKYVNDIADGYSEYVKAVANSGDKAANAKIELNVSDEAKNIINGLGGLGIDADWLNKLSMVLSANQNGTLLDDKFSINISDKEILTYNIIFDQTEQKLYMALKELSDKYIAFDLSESIAEFEEIYSQLMASKSEVEKILPNGAKVKAILEKYVEIALNNVSNVKSDSQELSINGVEEDCTVLSFNIDTNYAYNVLLDILNETLTNKDVKDIVTNFQKYGVENGAFEDNIDLYADFQELLKELIEELKAEEIDNQTFAILKSYVDGSHNVIGRSLMADIAGTGTFMDVLGYAMIEDNDDIGGFISVSGMQIVTYKGTKDGDIINAEAKISVPAIANGGVAMDLLSIKLENFDSENFVGTIRIAPGATLLSEMELPAAIASLNPELYLTFGDNSGEFGISSNGKSLIGLKLTVTEGQSSAIQVPNEAIDATDESAIEEWIKSFDFTTIIENLKAAGLPTEFTDALEVLKDDFANLFAAELAGFDDLSSNYEEDYEYYDEEIVDDYYDYY